MRGGGGEVQVYYGFTANFLAWGENNLSSFDVWMADVKRLLNQEGVMYKGEIVSTYMVAAFFSYSTLILSYSESSTVWVTSIIILDCCRLAFPTCTVVCTVRKCCHHIIMRTVLG